jgi:hypothetical protein
MGDDLGLLMALRVQGIARAERASVATGCDVTRQLQTLVDADFAKERTGRVSGFTLTPAGVDRLEKLLADEGMRTSERLVDAYDKFLLLNKRVLRVCSDWQLRNGDEPNDHSDAEYDETVLSRLEEIDKRAQPCVAELAACTSRFAPYGPRLAACVERLREGEHEAFTGVRDESYHTVWFQLHQDLLLTLGLKREE